MTLIRIGRPAHSCFAIAALFTLVLSACGSEDATRSATVAPIEAGTPSCNAQREGCVCGPSGTTAICSIKSPLPNGDTLCEGGEITCGNDGVWGVCVGNGQTSVLKK